MTKSFHLLHLFFKIHGSIENIQEYKAKHTVERAEGFPSSLISPLSGALCMTVPHKHNPSQPNTEQTFQSSLSRTAPRAFPCGSSLAESESSHPFYVAQFQLTASLLAKWKFPVRTTCSHHTAALHTSVRAWLWLQAGDQISHALIINVHHKEWPEASRRYACWACRWRGRRLYWL